MTHPSTYRPSLIVNTTQRCNYRCRMCFYSRPEVAAQLKDDPRTMPMDLFERVMHEVVPYCSTLCLAGAGEFLTDPLFEERAPLINATLKANPGVIYWQTTNASLLTPDRLGFLEGVPNVGFTISIDAADPKTYAYIRRPGKWERVSENIRNLRKHLYTIGVKDIGIQLNVVLMKCNALQLSSVVQFAREIRAKVFVDHPEGFGPDELREQSMFHYPVFTNEYLGRIREIAEGLGVPLSLPPPFAVTPAEIEEYFDASRNMARSCYELDRSGPIQVSHDGGVAVCCRTEFLFGNLNETPFEQIYNSPLYDTYREAIAAGDPIPPCDTCRHLYREARYLYESSKYHMDIPPEARNMSHRIDFNAEGFYRWGEEIGI